MHTVGLAPLVCVIVGCKRGSPGASACVLRPVVNCHLNCEITDTVGEHQLCPRQGLILVNLDYKRRGGGDCAKAYAHRAGCLHGLHSRLLDGFDKLVNIK